jgi:hypothetical protein
MKAWKVQKFFGDVAYDLRSRGLLPVVGLLVVAMIAVPILISRGSTANSTASLAPTANTAQTAPENERAVVAYSPAGIRNYKQRLNDLTAKNPFHQQFSHSAAATASALTSTVSIPTGSTSGTSPTVSPTVPSTGEGSTGSGGHKKKKRKKPNSTAITYQVDVLAGNVNATLTPFNNVPAMTALPSQTTPVAIYFGLSSDHASALFLLSNKVASVTGPGTCVPSPDDCALLALPAGQSEDLLYTQDGETYRIVVEQIRSSR